MNGKKLEIHFHFCLYCADGMEERGWGERKSSRLCEPRSDDVKPFSRTSPLTHQYLREWLFVGSPSSWKCSVICISAITNGWCCWLLFDSWRETCRPVLTSFPFSLRIKARSHQVQWFSTIVAFFQFKQIIVFIIVFIQAFKEWKKEWPATVTYRTDQRMNQIRYINKSLNKSESILGEELHYKINHWINLHTFFGNGIKRVMIQNKPVNKIWMDPW